MHRRHIRKGHPIWQSRHLANPFGILGKAKTGPGGPTSAQGTNPLPGMSSTHKVSTLGSRWPMAMKELETLGTVSVKSAIEVLRLDACGLEAEPWWGATERGWAAERERHGGGRWKKN